MSQFLKLWGHGEVLKSLSSFGRARKGIWECLGGTCCLDGCVSAESESSRENMSLSPTGVDRTDAGPGFEMKACAKTVWTGVPWETGPGTIGGQGWQGLL